MVDAIDMKMYGLGMQALVKGDIDYLNDTIKAALVTSTFTPNQDTDQFFNDISNEVSATGYTAGGATLASKTAAYNAGTNKVAIDAADVTWTITGTLTARHVIIYKDTGNAATSPLLGYGTFNDAGTPGDAVAIDGDFKLTWNANGMFELEAAA